LLALGPSIAFACAAYFASRSREDRKRLFLLALGLGVVIVVASLAILIMGAFKVCGPC